MKKMRKTVLIFSLLASIILYSVALAGNIRLSPHHATSGLMEPGIVFNFWYNENLIRIYIFGDDRSYGNAHVSVNWKGNGYGSKFGITLATSYPDGMVLQNNVGWVLPGENVGEDEWASYKIPLRSLIDLNRKGNGFFDIFCDKDWIESHVKFTFNGDTVSVEKRVMTRGEIEERAKAGGRWEQLPRFYTADELEKMKEVESSSSAEPTVVVPKGEKSPEIPVYGQEKYQVPNCYLEIANESAEHWDVLVRGEKIGVLNPHSTMRYSLNSCLAISVELHSNFPNFRTMHKAFYPNERRGNVYYWRLSYRN